MRVTYFPRLGIQFRTISDGEPTLSDLRHDVSGLIAGRCAGQTHAPTSANDVLIRQETEHKSDVEERRKPANSNASALN